jgi:hypothetical protein
MSSQASLMSSWRGRMQLAGQELAAEAAENPLANDPWFAPTSRLKGKADYDGWEYLESQQILDHLQIPMAARRASLFRRLTALMRAHNWEPIRIKRNGVDGGGVIERIRGYRRKTDRLPYPNVSQDHPGKLDNGTRQRPPAVHFQTRNDLADNVRRRPSERSWPSAMR